MHIRFLILLLTALCVLQAAGQNLTETNWALLGSASQSSTVVDAANPDAGNAMLAIDGNTNGVYDAATGSVTQSGGAAQDNGNPYWEVDLTTPKSIGRIHTWFRTDCCQNRNDDFTIIILATDRSEVWRQQYTGRPPLNVAYNLAPAVTGQFVRFVPQNPPTTSDGLFSLAEVQVFAPYTGVSINITQNPVDVSVTEGRRATFGPVTATVTGAPQDRLTIQWQKNGVDIPGAAGSSYTTPVALMTDRNTEYRARFLVSGQSVATSVGKLLVNKDTTPPVAESVVFSSGATLVATVKFNEIMDQASAEATGDYSFGAGVTVTQAKLSGVLMDPADQHLYQQVVLGVVGLSQNASYTLAVSGVKDLAGNTMTPANFTGTTPFFEVNWAQSGTATQSSTGVGGDAAHANDGNTDGYFNNGSVTLNEQAEDPGWWEVDLGGSKPIGRLKVWFRTLTADECSALFNSCLVRNDDFTLSILDAGRKVIWTTTYPGRPPLQVAYNLPPGVSGRYVRFESQTPLTTSDGFFSLAEAQAIAPYENVTLAITKDLTNAVSVTENQRALLGPVAATATGAPADVLIYQWQKNGADIVGANGTAYQTPPLALGDSNTRYRVNFLISGAVVASTEATVTVVQDTLAPTIKSVVGGFSYTDVTVIFSEAVSAATAGIGANYALSGGLMISGVTVLTPASVRLTTTTQTPGTKYTLTVNGIRDLASGSGNFIAANSKLDFTAPQTEANQFVVVGDPGNPKDTQWNTARGQVSYVYEISKYKVRNSEYAAFLNAKAKSDPHNLMVSGGGEIIRDGEDGSYSYTVLEGRENRPVLFVAAVDAMRMANWLNNGATQTADTETGSYTFTGYDVVSKRTPNARYVLPSDDEWYKAAYYDPTKNGTGGYWQYPPKTDDPAKMLAELPPGGPFSANFDNVNAADGNGTTDVGAYTAASSYYGTFDQAGCTWEWNEPTDPTAKVTSRRGGSQGNAVARLAAGAIASNGIDKGGATVNQGFRLGLVSPASALPKLTIEYLTPTSVRITWTGTGTLQTATTVDGQWISVGGNPVSPYLVNPTGTARYYRVSL